MKRREFIAGGLAAGTAVSALSTPVIAQGSDAIKLGMVIDTSGPLEVFGVNKLRALELAVDEINTDGGLLDREVQLIHRDTQSSNQLFGQFARELAMSERVDVLFGCTTSASREIVRPVVNRVNVPYFYNTNYEGGVCQRGTYCTSATPKQTVASIMPGLIKEHGSKVYVLAADYNFGHFSDQWARKIASDSGGEVIGSEFFPLDNSNFASTISKIQAEKPDIIHTVFVGPAHGAFWGQWASAGMVGQIPISSQTFGLAGEHLLLPPEMSEGIIVATTYFQELDSPENKAFVDAFTTKFGDDFGYIGELHAAEYQAAKLWAEAVKIAGSTGLDGLNAAFAQGVSITGPGGGVTLDPKTNHCVLDVHIGRVAGGSFDIVETIEKAEPTDFGGQCDLIANPNTNQQFEPVL